EPEGQPRVAQAGSLQGGSRRPGLHDARRRQGDRRRGTRAQARSQARAVGAAARGRGRRPGRARPGADPQGRGRPSAGVVARRASPRLAAYGVLCALGLVAALAGRRPEVAALVGPFALVLALAALADRQPRVTAAFSLARARALEGDEVESQLTLSSADGVS